MRRTLLLVVALCVLAATLAGVLWRLEARRPATLATSAQTPAGSALQQALAALREWDGARAAAYAEGDVAALRALYVTGSGAGARDAAMLRRYVARGLVVRDLRAQILRARLLDGSASRWRVVVTERLVAGRAVGAGTDLALPRGRARTRVVTLIRGDEGWLVGQVRAGAPPGPGRAGGTSAEGG